jgi:hypothetical protein
VVARGELYWADLVPPAGQWPVCVLTRDAAIAVLQTVTCAPDHPDDPGASARKWSDDVRTVTNAKNPALAVNSEGVLGLLFQQLVGTGAAVRWVTQLELTSDAWATPATNFVLHTALASTPSRRFLPYLGDYIRLLAVEDEFYGVFSGSNLPDTANFPNGVTYQRNADWNTRTLLGVNNTTPVQVSIDPFFVRYKPEPAATP